MWLTSKQFREKYKITPQHLYELKKTGKVKFKKTFNRSYLYEDTLDVSNNSIAIYCRVSTTKQTKDLDNQVEYLKKYALSNGYNPEYVFTDIASGMNEKRKGLLNLIELIFQYKISKVIISHKDRLTRFGYGYLESIFNLFGTSIEVVNLEDNKSFEEELTEDLISIIHHFSMKFYGKRKNKIMDIEKSIGELKNEK